MVECRSITAIVGGLASQGGQYTFVLGKESPVAYRVDVAAAADTEALDAPDD